MAEYIRRRRIARSCARRGWDHDHRLRRCGYRRGGVVTGEPAERRRERAIHQLHDHFIICGYGTSSGPGPDRARGLVPKLQVKAFLDETVAG